MQTNHYNSYHNHYNSYHHHHFNSYHHHHHYKSYHHHHYNSYHHYYRIARPVHPADIHVRQHRSAVPRSNPIGSLPRLPAATEETAPPSLRDRRLPLQRGVHFGGVSAQTVSSSWIHTYLSTAASTISTPLALLLELLALQSVLSAPSLEPSAPLLALLLEPLALKPVPSAIPLAP